MAAYDRDPENHSLILPCINGDLELVKRVVSEGADVVRDNCHAMTSLIITCTVGHCDILKYLISLGIDINRINVNGDTALHCCVSSGKLDCVKILVENGARLDIKFKDLTPLQQASVDGKGAIVYYLMNLPSCTRAARIEACEVLGATSIEDKDDLEDTDYYWLWSLGDRERAEPEDNVQPKRTEPHPVFGNVREFQTEEELRALEHSIDEVWMQCLLIRERVFGPQHSYSYCYVLQRALAYAKEGHFDRSISLMTYILDIQQKFDGVSYWTLRDFCSLINMFATLMSEGSPVKYKDVWAVFMKIIDILEHDMKPHLDDKQPWNYTTYDRALDSAIHSISLLAHLQPSISEDDRLQFRKVLYRFVKLNLRDRDGLTPLHIACLNNMTYYSPLDVVQVLLEVGADPQAVSVDGDTPLHSVATNEHSTQQDIIKLLLSSGTHYDVCNANGQCFTELLSSENTFKVDNLMDYVSLQYLSAKAVKTHGISYESTVATHLSEFIKIH